MLTSIGMYAQNDTNLNQLALLYYSQNEYTRAVELYEKLYSQTHSDIHFKYLLSCYKELDLYDKSEEIIQEQIKHKPDNFFYRASLIQLYQETGNTKEYQKLVKKTNRDALSSVSQTVELLQAYTNLSLYAVAENFVQEAKKEYQESPNLSKAISSLFIQTGQYAKTVDEYISLLLHSPEELSFIQNQLQFVIYEQNSDELTNILTEKVIEALNSHPKNSDLHELLIWIYIQEKDFSKALYIAKALDSREKRNGQDVFEVGKIAQSQKKYAAATESFSYILSQGIENPFYQAALKAILETAQAQLFVTDSVSREDLRALEQRYISALATLGKNNQTVDVARALAHLQAFYLDKSTEAQSLLEEMLTMPRIHPHEKALCQIELADIQVFNNDVWTANLLYAKIALEYKNNDIGHEARFKQAQLAYYNAQFSYAQALLDIIKASTTKLISNDALELSQLISKNTYQDSSAQALTLFSQADLFIYQKKYDEAIRLFDTISEQFPGHSLQSMILFRRAEIAKTQHDFDNMIVFLEAITEQYPYDIITHKAHFLLAEYYNYRLNDKDKAREHYLKIVKNFPNSFYLNTARKEYRSLLEQ
ncbi:MAG: tetratricopeptide repeat protein [Bacteroidales bacterium]|nr:tetratricopeptide repeat protein [Bacteroidales bacterium]